MNLVSGGGRLVFMGRPRRDCSRPATRSRRLSTALFAYLPAGGLEANELETDCSLQQVPSDVVALFIDPQKPRRAKA